MKRLLTIGMVTAAFLAAGCGSSITARSTLTPTSSLPASVTTQPTAAPSATPAPAVTAAPSNALTSWCGLKLLEPKTFVLDLMSSTSAQQTHDYDAVGASLLASVGFKNYSFDVWYASHSTLFATFNEYGKTVNLQAYVKGSLSTGSAELGCTDFRS